MSSASHLGYFSGRQGKTPNHFPVRILLGAIALLGFAVAAIIFGQSTGMGLVKQQYGSPVAIRDIVITRTVSDRVVVTDARTGTEIAGYDGTEGGFVRGSLRALDRMRQIAGVPVDTPYRLIKWQTGRISLSDTATGERLYLDAFGKDNAGAFEALLGNQGGERP